MASRQAAIAAVLALAVCAAGIRAGETPADAPEAEVPASTPPSRVPPGGIGWRYDGTGIFPATAPPARWNPESGKNILWSHRFGRYRWGNAQPVAVGDRVFVCEETHYLSCFDAATGRRLWHRDLSKLHALDSVEGEHAETFRRWKEWAARREAARRRAAELEGPERKKAENEVRRATARCEELGIRLNRLAGIRGVPWKTLMGYTFATPVTDGRRIYGKVATGAVWAVDLEGHRVWMRAFPYNGGHSSVSSPRLAGGRLIFSRPGPMRVVGTDEEGKPKRAPTMMLTALDPDTGRTVWESPPLRKSKGDGTPSPIPLLLDGVPLVIADGGDVFRAADGRRVAREVSDSTYCTTVSHDEVVYFCVDGFVQAVRLRWAGKEKEAVEAETLWRVRPEHEGTRSNQYGGPVYWKGYVHVFQDFGQYYVLDARDGRVLHTSLPLGGGKAEKVAIYANLSVAGGRLYGLDQRRGRMIVLEPGPSGRVLARNGPLGKGTGSPLFHGGRVFVRTHERLWAIGRK